MKIKGKKLWIGVGLVIVLMIAAGLVYLNREKNPVAEVFRVEPQNIEEKVLATGRVTVPGSEQLYAGTSGVVQTVQVKLGNKVKAGQELMQLDTSELEKKLKQAQADLATQQANLAQAQAAARTEDMKKAQANLYRAEKALKLAKEDVSRNQYLFDAGAIAKDSLQQVQLTLVSKEADYQAAKSDFDKLVAGEAPETIKALQNQVSQAELAVDIAQEDLAKATVKASRAGIVLALEAEAGQYVANGAPLITVGNLQNLAVKAEVNEADSGKLAVGQKVKITSKALTGEEFSGEVSLVAPSAVTETTSQGNDTKVEISVKVSNASDKLKPGYSVNLEIVTASVHQALSIPYEAIFDQADSPAVFVVEAGKIRRRKIKTGIGNELYCEVQKGLKAGEQIIKNPNHNWHEGMVVEIQQAKQLQKGGGK